MAVQGAVELALAAGSQTACLLSKFAVVTAMHIATGQMCY